MKNIKLDKDLIISIFIALLVSLIVFIIVGILALIMSWWLIYILLFSILTPICYSIVKKYREDPDSINKFMIELFGPMYDYKDEEEDNLEKEDNITDEPYF